MNFNILAVVVAIWLAAISYLTSLSTLITSRPIEFGIVIAMLVLVGLMTQFARNHENAPDLANRQIDAPEVAPRAEDTVAGLVANGIAALPLNDDPLPAGIGG